MVLDSCATFVIDLLSLAFCKIKSSQFVIVSKKDLDGALFVHVHALCDEYILHGQRDQHRHSARERYQCHCLRCKIKMLYDFELES